MGAAFRSPDSHDPDHFLPDRTPEECMDICAHDGYLTYFAIRPEKIPSSKWLRYNLE